MEARLDKSPTPTTSFPVLVLGARLLVEEVFPSLVLGNCPTSHPLTRWTGDSWLVVLESCVVPPPLSTLPRLPLFVPNTGVVVLRAWGWGWVEWSVPKLWRSFTRTSLGSNRFLRSSSNFVGLGNFLRLHQVQVGGTVSGLGLAGARVWLVSTRFHHTHLKRQSIRVLR